MSKWLKPLLFFSLFIITSLLLNLFFSFLGWSRDSKIYIILFLAICGVFLLLSFWYLGSALEEKFPTITRLVHIMTILAGGAAYLNIFYDVIKDIID